MKEDPLRKGRLGDDRPDDVMQFLSSMDADRWIADADILVDIAHLLMLHRQSIIDVEPARAIMKVLLNIHENGVPSEVFDDRFEDIHAGIEAYLISRTGTDAGGRLHMGRSRNDEVATCIRLRLREELLLILRSVLDLRKALLDSANLHTGSIMPGFTHFQHAQPTTLAHHLLAYEQAFGRDFDRFMACMGRVDASPLGAAAFASTGYPIDREYTRDLLGFETIVLNTMDAVSSRDFALEVMAACTLFMSQVSRLCEELVVWSSSFVDFVELADAYCSTSSIMPQKKNPDTAEIMRAKTGRVTGALTAGLMDLKGLPMSYNRDLQDLTPHLWEAVFETGRSASLLTGMITTAQFNTPHMRAEAGQGFSTATELADVLVRDYRIPFRTAHGIVGRAVKMGSLDLATLEEAAKEMAGISLKECGLTDDAREKALDVVYSVEVRDRPGGPSREQSTKMIELRKKRLFEDTRSIREIESRIDSALDLMIAAAGELIRE